MESLATFVGYLLLAMLLVVLTVIVLSILVALNKVPKVIGYVAFGVQAALTLFTFQLTQMLFQISLSILLVSAVLVFYVPYKRNSH
ncbi:MAG: hypothetical protein RLZZ606_526 [Actinomycetota bacterium]|jgi:hypothetical protein